MEKHTVRYFGYGTNVDPEMMEAIIGRKPEGQAAVLKGYILRIQKWEQIPLPVKKVLKLSWKDGEFWGTYTVNPMEGKEVEGVIWYISQQEREIVGQWEMDNFWYSPLHIEVITKQETVMKAETQIIQDSDDNLKKAEEIFGSNLPLYIVNQERMHEVANKVRTLYLKGVTLHSFIRTNKGYSKE